MNPVDVIAQRPAVQAAVITFRQKLRSMVELIVEIQQIPSPTFAEQARANFVQERFAALGLTEVHQDHLHNVFARLPGKEGIRRAPVILSAHSDTVFSAETDLAVVHKDQFVAGPGITDNSTGVAALLVLAEALLNNSFCHLSDIWFVCNVGEEGLGDLRGMRAVVDRFGENAYYLILEGGLFGQISHQAIGVQRYRIEVTAPGGHSWANFGHCSAVHELGLLIAAVDALEVPSRPKTAYNVGVISGGTSVNTIAQAAEMLLDLRSEETTALEALVSEVTRIVQQANARSQRDNLDVTVTMRQVGNRPSGHIPRQTPLILWAESALRHVGCDNATFIAGSTDANVPLSKGYNAVCVGVSRGGNPHRLDEYLDTSFLPDGLGQILMLTLAAAGLGGQD